MFLQQQMVVYHLSKINEFFPKNYIHNNLVYMHKI